MDCLWRKITNVDFIVQRTDACSKGNVCHYESNKLNAHKGIFCSNTKSGKIGVTCNNCSIGECAQIRKADLVPQ